MSKQCSHKDVRQHYYADPIRDNYGCVQHRCGACDATLAIGPSHDDGEAIKVEIRAAEIASSLKNGGCEMSMLECCGFNDELPKLRGGGVVLLDSDSEAAGHLAHCIVTHEDQDL